MFYAVAIDYLRLSESALAAAAAELLPLSSEPPQNLRENELWKVQTLDILLIYVSLGR